MIKSDVKSCAAAKICHASCKWQIKSNSDLSFQLGRSLEHVSDAEFAIPLVHHV